MPKMKLSKGLRKYVRREKARVRREVLDIDERKKKIDELYKNLFGQFSPQEKIEKPTKEEKKTKKKNIKIPLVKTSEGNGGEESKKKIRKEKEKNAKNKKIRK